MTLCELLWPEGCGTVALVGGGGKTSLMSRAADEAQQLLVTADESRPSLLVTTTTRLQRPTPINARIHIGETPPETTSESVHLWVGGLIADGKKWKAPPLSALAGWVENHPESQILIEADGSSGRPLKAPGPGEPVIPGYTQTVICVMGLSALGRQVSGRNVHRLERFEHITGFKSGTPITRKAVLRLLSHPDGGFKGTLPGMRRILVINQADDAKRVRIGASLARRAMDTVPELTAAVVTKFGQDGIIRFMIGS